MYDDSEGPENEEELEDSEQGPNDESLELPQDLGHVLEELRAEWDGDSDNDYGDAPHLEDSLGRIKWRIFGNLGALGAMPEGEAAPEVGSSQRNLQGVLKELSQDFPIEYLTYLLSHRYGKGRLSSNGLRGKDRWRALHLLEACGKVGSRLYLARIRRTIEGTFSGSPKVSKSACSKWTRSKSDSSESDGFGSDGSESDSSEYGSSVPPELTGVEDEKVEISGAYEIGGRQIAEDMSFKKSWLIQQTLIDRRPKFAIRPVLLHAHLATYIYERTVRYFSFLRKLPLAYSLFLGFGNRAGIQSLTVHGRGRKGRLLLDGTSIV